MTLGRVSPSPFEVLGVHGSLVGVDVDSSPADLDSELVLVPFFFMLFGAGQSSLLSDSLESPSSSSLSSSVTHSSTWNSPSL